MGKNLHIDDESLAQKINELQDLHGALDNAMRHTYDRSLPLNEELSDRWLRAQTLGFGEGCSIYDNSYVYGKPNIGKSCWIGPQTVIDGSGGLTIGDGCTISIGSQIYTHNNVKQTLTSGRHPIERKETTIGNNVYVGPNSIITMGVSVGDNCVIGAFTLINKDIPANSIVIGQPGKVVGTVVIEGDQVRLEYT